MIEPQARLQPQIGFMIGGMQKSGTSALVRYLSAHPQIALPLCKEAHVFDAADFDDGWTRDRIEACFASRFEHRDDVCLYGDATPITVFHPRLIERVAAYNPAMRWVLLLRNPVERAISQHAMERARGFEPHSLLVAAWRERRRLHGHEDDWSKDSPLRHWSYAARGHYVRQLDALLARFPREQVLLLRSQDLSTQPHATLAQVLAFLGLPPFTDVPDYAPVFQGDYRKPGRLSPARWLLRWLLRGQVRQLHSKYGIDIRQTSPWSDADA